MSVIDKITDWLISHSPAATLELGANKLLLCDGKYHKNSFVLNNLRSARSEIGYINKEDKSDTYNPVDLEAGIERLCSGKLLAQKHVSIIVPDFMFHIGSVYVQVDATKTGVKPFLERELQKSAPRPYGEYSLKYEVAERKGDKINIQFTALANEVIDVLTSVCAKSNLVPISIQPAFVGLFKLLSLKPNESEHPGVFLHFDMQGTTIGIYDKNGLRSLSKVEIGVNKLIKAVKTCMECDDLVAWRTLFTEPLLLEDPSAADAQLEINSYSFVEAILADFLQKIYGILLLFSSENPQNSGFTRIIISGQGAMIRNIDRLVAYNLGIPSHTISQEFAETDVRFPDLQGETIETLAAVLGSIVLEPAKIKRYDRIMAA